MGQDTVFSLFQNSQKAGDTQFAAGNYTQAISHYTAQLAKDPGNVQTQLKLAEAHYKAKDYTQAVNIYDRYMTSGRILPVADMYYYAEANVTLGHRTVALDYYKRCLAKQPDNDLLTKKIWRLTNLQYLYEDSAHYAVRPVAVNTPASELCAVPYKDGFVFTSNRKGGRIVELTNRKLNTPFYRLYEATWKEDTATHIATIAGKPVTFGSTLKARYNTGPVAFYDNGNAMVFVTASESQRADGLRTLGLYFAKHEGNKWKVLSAFPYNSNDYSIHDVSVSRDGKTLYFSSDMPGGNGGKDIYTSQYMNGQWTRPRNIGEPVNTPLDEQFPYLHGQTLYFSSDGQPGMGQLDIFKTYIREDGYDEPENLGYPINSPYDDFALTLDSAGTHGYLASNRIHGKYDDDIYEVDMDLQTYPLTIAAVLKYKEQSWSDQSALIAWPKTRIELIDGNTGNITYKTTTDLSGGFSIEIPHYSRYYVRIVDDDGHEYKASFELSKYKKESSVHEVVIMKDIFKKNTDKK